MSFLEKDLFGVQCHVCHRLMDPTAAPAAHPDVRRPTPISTPPA